jgi:phosphate-selective porin
MLLRFHRRLLCILIGCSLVAHAAETSVDERLRRLESTVDSLQKENADLRRQLGVDEAKIASAPKSSVITPNGHETKLVIGGFIHAQAEFGDAADERWVGTNDRFYFRRARFYVTGQFAENFTFKVEADLSASSLTPATGIRAIANDMWVGWSKYDFAILRFGQLKPAFGAEQLLSDLKLATIERSLANDRLTDPRQLGLELGGEFFNHRLGYLAVVGNGNGPSSSANDNNKFMHTGRVYGTPIDNPAVGRLTVGADGMIADDAAVTRAGFGFDSVPGVAIDNVFVGRRLGSGIDATWHRGPLDVTAEYLRLHFHPRDQIPKSSFSGEGWQITASCFVVPQKLQGVVRYESFDPNLARSGDDTQTWVVGFNYFIKGDDLRLLVNYMFSDAAALPNAKGRLLTRFQLVF